MTKNKHTKRALLASVLSMFVCIAMLIGSTFAWFTDTATTAVNSIQSGTLDVALEDAEGNSLEGKTLEWKTADNRAQDQILWEPGCTYELQPVYIKNNGNLALKYKIVINGVNGDAKLLEAIDFTYDGIDISEEGHLKAGEKSDAITITGKMKESAGNDYQGLSIKGIGITVVATQDTVEYDSFGNQYDKKATYTVLSAYELEKAFEDVNNDDDSSEKVILVGDDITVDEDTTLELKDGSNVTLDIVGNDLTVKNGKDGNDRHGIEVEAGANLTITDSIGDGTLDLTVSDHTGTTYDSGTVVLDQKSFPFLLEGDNHNKATANFRDIVIDVHDNDENSVPVSIMAKKNGVLNLGEGTVINGYDGKYVAVYASDGSVVNVDGAEVNLTGSGVAFAVGSENKAESVLNINSGSIRSNCAECFMIEVNDNGVVNMTGGSIELYGDIGKSLSEFAYVFLTYTGGSINVTGGEITLAPTSGVAIMMYGSAVSENGNPSSVFGGNAVMNLNATGSAQAWGFLIMKGTAYVRDKATINIIGRENQNGMLNPGWSTYDSYVKDERNL